MTSTSSMRDVVLEQKERTRKSSRADIQRFIEQSELQIISLESQITALVQLRDRERICVAALRHLHSPIHILPVELLVEIFELTFREYTHIKDVFRISQVCSDWRQVTRSTPQLWARPIHLDPRHNQDRRGSNRIHADDLKAWLLRSAPLAVPVSLVLDYESANHGISDEVLTTAPRWRSLHLDGPFYTPMPFLSRLAQAKLDNLEELVPLRFSKDVDLAAFPSFTSAPRLKKLFMQIHSKALPILLPWAQLIDLTLVSDFLRLTLDILTQCTELTRATIHTTALPDGPGPLEDRRANIAFSHLRTLTIRSYRSKSRLIPFLACLSAPVLEELHLDFDHAVDRRWAQSRFTEFQLRSPNITRLELMFSSLTADELMTAMHHAPSLTHLKLIHCDYCFDDALIDALRYEAGAIPLVPHLHNLFLEHIGSGFTEDKLADMIASRWWANTELVPPPVARWTRVQLYDFSDHFVGMLEYLPSDVLMTH